MKMRSQRIRLGSLGNERPRANFTDLQLVEDKPFGASTFSLKVGPQSCCGQVDRIFPARAAAHPFTTNGTEIGLSGLTKGIGILYASHLHHFCIKINSPLLESKGKGPKTYPH